MFNGDFVFAIVPARGGSKGLPGKNLMKINGMTLIETAVRSAVDPMMHQGNTVDVVLVSSDDDAILAEAKRVGAINHRRDEVAASDDATAGDVIRDFLDNADVSIDPSEDPWILYLQPTSPARHWGHVEAAFELLRNHPEAKALVSVAKPDKSPYWSFTIGREDGRLHPLFPEAFAVNRQELDDAYLPNGAIYLFKLSEFLKTGRFPMPGAVPFVMSTADSVDIDTQADFDRAKALLER